MFPIVSSGRGRANNINTSFDNPRGRGRGAPPPRQMRDPDYRPVPPYSSIHPGTPVSMILKEDQSTGHQVKGLVADLLTRGDHPRGVKVRLRDGRVGRVQQLVSEAEGERGEAVVGGAGAGLGRNGEGGRGRGMGMVGGRVERDIREEDEYLYTGNPRGAAELGLFAQLEEADRRHRGESGRVGQRGEKGEEEVATCPVCGEFEGDEVAVAHHVEGHFGE
ncbi:hypothetical protein EJ02DRAFT_487163 [Clathrospora elynae]|uniref:Uncharacterized protein n=1 Tax=Clathrospora elynae TaxID=706981 RepID=A0A6A5S321_9PLEO|nr:hypothetical protein EJ02DRAFT_487163 [Clathrospora elynae]